MPKISPVVAGVMYRAFGWFMRRATMLRPEVDVGRRQGDVGEVRHLGLDPLRRQRLPGEPAGHHAELDAGDGVDVDGDARPFGTDAGHPAEENSGVGHGQPFTAPAVMPATKKRCRNT